MLALAALAAGALAWRPLPPGVWHDDGVYLMLGRALARGDGLHYLGVPGNPAAPKFPPAYPLVAASAWLLGGDALGAARAAAMLNVLFLAGAAGLTAAWARRGLALPLPLALTAGGLTALSVDLWRPAFVALSEPLYVLAMVGALVAAARAEREGATWREGVQLLALLALLVHVRTAGVAVAGGVIVGLGVRRRWRPAWGIAAGLGFLMAPWALWSSAAGRSLPEPLRDILGPYGPWLIGAVKEDPLRYLRGRPGAALDAIVGTVGLLIPAGLPAAVGWILGPLLAATVLAGALGLARRSPSASLALAFSLVMAALWPYEARRLLLPLVPILAVALACAADPIAAAARREGGRPGRRRLAPMVLAAMGVWAVGFGGLSAVRLAAGWATAGYEVRAVTLGKALEALRGRVPADAVVGAPELWAAVPLLTGHLAAPSARFLAFGGEDGSRAGTPGQQFRLWQAAGVDHLLLERGGAVHGKALDTLEAACPGAVGIVQGTSDMLLIRLGWDAACRARVAGLP